MGMVVRAEVGPVGSEFPGAQGWKDGRSQASRRGEEPEEGGSGYCGALSSLQGSPQALGFCSQGNI